jgi:hypothetical protein
LFCSSRFGFLKKRFAMPKSDHRAALVAIENILALLRSVLMTLEGTDKNGVDLPEMAVENLKN